MGNDMDYAMAGEYESGKGAGHITGVVAVMAVLREMLKDEGEAKDSLSISEHAHGARHLYQVIEEEMSQFLADHCYLRLKGVTEYVRENLDKAYLKADSHKPPTRLDLTLMAELIEYPITNITVCLEGARALRIWVTAVLCGKEVATDIVLMVAPGDHGETLMRRCAEVAQVWFREWEGVRRGCENALGDEGTGGDE